MKSYKFFGTLTCIFFFAVQVFGQQFSTKVISKTPIYSNTSIVYDYDGDDDLDIVITELDPSRVVWLENEPNQQFSPATIIEDDITNPRDIDVADFDNDGNLDILVCSGAQGNFDGELVWFQKQSNDSYIKWSIDVGRDYDEADVGDFNGDGNIDIVAVGFSQDEVNVFLNDGNFNFTISNVVSDLNINGQVDKVDADDIDGDGDIDIAFGDGNVNGMLYLNDGNANFNLGAELFGWNDFSASSGNSDLVITDLNNDGIKDILTFTGQGLGGLYFLDGSNSFDQSVIDREGIDNGGGIVVADIDQNGLLDIVRQHWTENFVSILYQTSPLNFTKEYLELNWDAEQDGSQMVAADIDGDGDQDVVIPQKRTIDRDLAWFENIDGKLYRHFISAQLIGARIPKLADFDSDGDLDIFLTISENSGPEPEDEVMLYENLDGTNFLNWRISDRVDYAADIEMGDMDGDGDLDAVVTARDANDLLIMQNDGFQADWSTDTIEQNANNPLGIVLDDLDGDNDLDIILCSFGDAKIYTYSNLGNLEFVRSVVDPNFSNPREVETADINNDGFTDIVVISTDVENSIAVYINDGNGNFVRNILYSGKSGRDLELGDWDNDGDIDILGSFSSNSTVPDPVDVVLLLNNDGDFNVTDLISITERTSAIHLVDADADNDLDIVFGFNSRNSSQPNLINIGINNGEGQVNDIISISNNENGEVLGIDVGDLDNDGNLELVYTDFNRDELVLVDFDLITNTQDLLHKLSTKVSVYPNPASSVLELSSESIDMNYFVLINNYGQIITEGPIEGYNYELNTSNLSKGIYYIQIKTSIGVITKKIIRQ